jgi:hypothetical protein
MGPEDQREMTDRPEDRGQKSIGTEV